VRVEIAVASLRTNLTVRELAAVFGISKSQTQRIIDDLVPTVASLFTPPHRDRRETWVVDGTLVPTRDHNRAAKSKNYRYSTNLQVVARARDRAVVHVARAWPGNRNDPIPYRGERVDEVVAGQRRVLGDSMYRACGGVTAPPMRGSRVDREHPGYASHVLRRARAEHTIAHLKSYRVLRDCRRRGAGIDTSAHAVAFLHNLRIGVYA
jgi:hypothetical protein